MSRLCCGSGLGRIRIILSDRDRHPGHADPERYQFQENQECILNLNLSLS